MQLKQPTNTAPPTPPSLNPGDVVSWCDPDTYHGIVGDSGDIYLKPPSDSAARNLTPVFCLHRNEIFYIHPRELTLCPDAFWTMGPDPRYTTVVPHA